MRPALACILLLGLLPLPFASAQETWSLDARVSVTGGTSAEYTWTVRGLPQHTALRLPIPDNATFLEARDGDGRTLEADVEGDDVEVVLGRGASVIEFLLEGERDGPFVLFPAQVAADARSPVTVALALPSGWSLAGYRSDEEGDAPDGRGVFSRTGPAYVQFLVLPDEEQDPGADPTVAGRTVKRAGLARIAPDGIAWSLTTTYDTDVYRREWDVVVPEGARVIGASTPFGPLPTTIVDGSVHVRTPYPTGYGLGARSFTIDMALPAPDAHGGAFRQANLSIHAGSGDVVTLDATLDDGSRYAGARTAGGREGAPLRFSAAGPLSVTIAFLPPARPGHVQFEEGGFIVDAPAELHAAALATARNASEELPRVASFAYARAADRPFFVSYTDAPVFGWEQGFYSNGLNTITIRRATLDDAPADGAPHLVPVGVLVHEATHGLIDRLLPDVPHELSFLHEGLARLAETRLEEHFAHEVLACRIERSSQNCTVHSARPRAEELQSYHQDRRVFDPAWSASSVPTEERSDLYDLSGLILHAYDRRAPPGALENALAHLRVASFGEDPAAGARLVVDVLLANAPGTSENALLYPGREVAPQPAEEFRHCLGPLVAPPYPWEDEARAPRGGCPATGYGGAEAELPPAPEPEPEPEPTSPSATTPAAPTRPTFQVPTSFPEDEPDPAPPTDDPRAPTVAPPGSSPTPGAGLALVVAAIAALALARRRA